MTIRRLLKEIKAALFGRCMMRGCCKRWEVKHVNARYRFPIMKVCVQHCNELNEFSARGKDQRKAV